MRVGWREKVDKAVSPLLVFLALVVFSMVVYVASLVISPSRMDIVTNSAALFITVQGILLAVGRLNSSGGGLFRFTAVSLIVALMTYMVALIGPSVFTIDAVRTFFIGNSLFFLMTIILHYRSLTPQQRKQNPQTMADGRSVSASVFSSPVFRSRKLRLQPTSQPPAPSFEKEKVGMFWDYKRGTLFTFLGFYVSAFLAVVFNADKFASGWWILAVIGVSIVVLVVLGLDVWRRLQLLAVQVSRYMTQAESGISLGRFDQMLGLPEIIKGTEPLDVDRLRTEVIPAEPQPYPSRQPEVQRKVEGGASFSFWNATRALARSLPSVEELTLESVERFNKSTLFLNIRNPGQREVRINRYSVNRGEPIGRAPPLVIHPGSVERLKVSQDL